MDASLNSQPSPQAHPRARALAAFALALTIPAGLASRRWPLPGVLAEYLGDALYAVAAAWAFALLWPGWTPRRIALAAFGASALVELSQLWHPAWLDTVRGTMMGRLLLGSGFQLADLVAYALGALAAGALARAACHWAARPPG